jgi:transcription-repair coupling factor (superfamily II helicase)
VPAERVIELVQKQSHRYKFASANQIAIMDTIDDREKRFKFIENLLERFLAA